MKKKKKPIKKLVKSPAKSPSELKSFIPSLAVFIAFCAWGWLVVSNYLKKFPMSWERFESAVFSINPVVFVSGVFHQFSNVLLALWIFAVSFGLGLVFIKYLKVAEEKADERFVFSVGIGLVFLTYLTFGFGVMGLLYKSVFYAVLAALTVFLIFRFKAGKFSFRPDIKWNFSNIVLLLAILIIALINFTVSLSPELFYDALVYHLAIPQYYVLHHKIVNMPHVFFSHFPVNMGMIYTMSLLLGDDILAKLTHFFMGGFSIAAIYVFSKKYFNKATGIMAAAIFYTMPMVAMSSWSAGTELALTFYQILGFWAVFNYFYDEKKSIKWLVLSGVFSGMACGIKYTGVFSLAAIIILLIIKLRSQKEALKDIAKKAIIVGSAASLLILPTLVKNYVYTKNPVHPYLSGVFGRVGMSDDKVRILSSETKKRTEFKAIEYLKLPWNLTMNGKSSESFSGFVFLLFIPLPFMFRKPRSKIKYLMGYFILTYLMWSGISYFLRYFMPGLAFLSLIISYFLINNSFNKRLKNFLIAAAVFAVCVNLYWSAVCSNIEDKIPVITGRETKDHYLGRSHSGYPHLYYNTVKYMNENSPKDSKVLFIGEHRGFYSERIFIAGSVHDDAMILRWIKDCENENDLYAVLAKEKITHMLVSLREGIRVRGYNVYKWTPREMKLFNKFWKNHIKEEYVADDVYLYRIVKGKTETAPPVNTVFAMYVDKVFSEAESGSFEEQISSARDIMKKIPETVPLYAEAVRKISFAAYFDGIKNLSFMEYSEGRVRNALEYMRAAMKQRPDQKKYRDFYAKLKENERSKISRKR